MPRAAVHAQLHLAAPPAQWRAMLPYLGMSYLDERSTWLGYWLIRLRLTHAVWAPLVTWLQRRHLRYRRQPCCEAGERHALPRSATLTALES